MSEWLTDEQLREWMDRYPEHPYAEKWSGRALIDELLVLRAELEKARADCGHWAADYTELQVTIGRYIAQRDSARALLRECVPELRICNADLRARIAKELGE